MPGLSRVPEPQGFAAQVGLPFTPLYGARLALARGSWDHRLWVKPARLKSIPVFAGLSRHELLRVADCAEQVDVREGEPLLEQGRFAFEFLAIEKGAAEVVRDGSHVADLGPGDVMGELAALSHGRRNASVVATAPTRVIFIRAQDFRHFAEELPALGAEIRRVVQDRTRAMAARGY